jgi:hypothetical protein
MKVSITADRFSATRIFSSNREKQIFQRDANIPPSENSGKLQERSQ